MTEPAVKLYLGDCLDVMRGMADNSIDAVVTDPPYGLAFMGKKWDASGIANSVEMWREVLRVMKPGAYLLAFGGTRTYHRMTCAIENAGFEIRDCIEWVYGCLSDDTEILTINGWERYHKHIVNNPVLCYNVDKDSFEFHKPSRSFVYENEHTAYRIQSDSTDQLVSRNHRVLVERCGRKVFAYAEELQPQESVPILESLRDLPERIPNLHEGTSVTKQDLLTRVQRQENISIQEGEAKGQGSRPLDSDEMRLLREANRGEEISGGKEQGFLLQSVVPRKSIRQALTSVLRQWKGKEETWQGIGRRQESCLEGWSNLLSQAWQLCVSQVCSLSQRVFADGTQGRLCYGTPTNHGSIAWQIIAESRSCASHQPRSDRQSAGKLDAIQNQSRAQATRRTRATVTPIEYTGRMWCVSVPTGAFVARRNGHIFITGNSGFPKSLDVSKAIDKAAGAEREVVSSYEREGRRNGILGEHVHVTRNITSPATDLAREWAGWGTALKPAHEPIVVARKPLGEATVAANCLRWGTGAVNVDAGRVGTNGGETHKGGFQDAMVGGKVARNGVETDLTQRGRWPANLVTDGSPEVVAMFPQTTSGARRAGLPPSGPSLAMNVKGGYGFKTTGECKSSTGSAARFFAVCPLDEGDYPPLFYCAKASKSDRNAGLEDMPERTGDYSLRNGICKNCGKVWIDGKRKGQCCSNPDRTGQTIISARNFHPTCKPTSLMRYLITLCTREGATVLDPFLDSGTTGVAAVQLGRSFIGIELDVEYFEIARARIAGVQPKLL